MKKLGLVTVTYVNNYGSHLQSFALQEKLKALGYIPEIINIDSVKKSIDKRRRKYIISRLYDINEISAYYPKLKKKIAKIIENNCKKIYSNRAKKFKEFAENYYDIAPKVNNWDGLSKQCKERFSAVIVGSDQNWRPANIAGGFYTLEFVPNNINKIAYATSFGLDHVIPQQKDKARFFLGRIDHLSVRENSGKAIVKDLLGKDIPVVCDPTLLLNSIEWDNYLSENPIVDGKYILCYFLGKNKEHWDFAKRLKKKTGLKIVGIPFGEQYVKDSTHFMDEIPSNVGPFEFINLIKHASYICTDSFHGCAFSINYNKNVFAFYKFVRKGNMSTNGRIDTLFGWTKLKHRILSGKEPITDLMLRDIDYRETNRILDQMRKNSLDYLINAIGFTGRILNSNTNAVLCKTDSEIILADKTKCCGCSACFNACKFGALSMEPDEGGFLYPKMDENKCKKCGACLCSCPALNSVTISSNDPVSYIVQNKNEKIRRQSTSGGAFTEIAKHIIGQGGYVFGAAMDDNFNVRHIKVNTENGLSFFRNSKYVQSSIGTSYCEAKSLLNKGKMVCFSGTPCQISGLKQYLGKEYDNLITVDVMCRAVPSPKALKKYIDFQRIKYPSFDRIVFRDKARGYSYSGIALYHGNKALYRGSSESDRWLRLFLGGFCNRASCGDCKYQTDGHPSDISICDWWEVSEIDKSMDDNKGTTGVAIWTKKGIDVFDAISKQLVYKSIDSELMKKRLTKRGKPGKGGSKQFYKDLNTLNSLDFMNKYVPNSYKTEAKRIARYVLYRVRIHDLLKKSIRTAKKINKE